LAWTQLADDPSAYMREMPSDTKYKIEEIRK
jgi:hypothetical protein